MSEKYPLAQNAMDDIFQLGRSTPPQSIVERTTQVTVIHSNYGGFEEPVLPLPDGTTIEKPPSYAEPSTEVKKHKTLNEKLHDFADDTTAHGIPRIISRPNYFSKLFWLLLVIGAFYLFGSQGWEIVSDFYAYNTKIELVTKREINFPAVTVCNLNRMARSKLLGTRFEGIIDIDGGWGFDEGETNYDWFFDFSSDWWNAYSYTGSYGGSPSYSGGLGAGRKKRDIMDTDDAEEDMPLERSKRMGGSYYYNYGSYYNNYYYYNQGSYGYNYNNYYYYGGPGGYYYYYNADWGYYDYSWVFEYDNYYDWGDVTDENDWQGFYDASTSEDFSDILDVINPTADELELYGHEPDDFIIQCTFDKRMCNYTDFRMFQNRHYGNCFTFNGKLLDEPMSVVRNSSKAGSQYGLHLTLFIEQPEYIGLLTPDSGVRVDVHANDVFSFPEDTGISAGTGQSTAIGIRQTELTRLEHPWGDCTSSGVSYLYDEFYTYTQRSCEKGCLLETMAHRCSCVTEIYTTLDAPKCSFLNSTQQRCRQLVEELYNNDELNCVCPTPCHEFAYNVQATTTLWPSERYEEHLYSRVSQKNEIVAQVLQNVEATRKNLARVKVYFEDLNYQSIEQVKAHTLYSILGSVGGLMGLYVGISLITIFEFIVLAFDIFYHCLKVIFCRSKVKPVIT